LKSQITLLALCTLLSATVHAAESLTLPADPPAKRTVELVEQWRIGDDEDDVLLGVITHVEVDAAGQVYLVDRQLSQVQVIGPDGEPVTTLGREGEGPGELNQPHAMVLLDDGAIGLVQGFPGRIIGLNGDGTPAGDITIGGSAEEGGFNFVRECLRVGDGFVANTGRMVFDINTGKANRTTTLGVYDRQGALTATIADHTIATDMSRQTFDEAAEFSEINEWTASGAGQIYTTPVHEEYQLTVRDLSGNTLYSLQRPFTPRKRSQAEKDAMANNIRIRVEGQNLETDNRALDVDPAIRDLAVADDGRLFVTNCYQYRAHLPTGTAGRYDVISTAGQYIEELTLLVPDFDGSQDVLFFIDGTHFAVFKNFDSAAAAMDPEENEEQDDVGEDAEPFAVIFLTMP